MKTVQSSVKDTNSLSSNFNIDSVAASKKNQKKVLQTIPDTLGISTINIQDSIFDACNVLLKQPIAIKRVDPVIPTFIHRELRATVFVKCLVGVDGKVKKAEVMKSDSEIFNQTVLDAALQWEFTPVESGEKVVEAWVVIPFHIKTGK